MDGQGGYVVLHVVQAGTSLQVDFDLQKYARVAHKDANVEAEARARWDAASSANAALFNARKFRYAGLVSQPGGATLQVGLTDYATFIGTHGAANPLETFGMRGLALPLGNAIIATTTDGKAVFLRRSSRVGEGKGRVVFPGGHPEPDEMNHDEDGSEAVRRELWAAARRETMEELFLTDEQTPRADALCLGLVARAHDGKVCQVFHMPVMADSSQVAAQFKAGEKDESDRIIFKELNLLQTVRETACVDGLVLMPDHLGALQLWLDSRHLSDRL